MGYMSAKDIFFDSGQTPVINVISRKGDVDRNRLKEQLGRLGFAGDVTINALSLQKTEETLSSVWERMQKEPSVDPGGLALIFCDEKTDWGEWWSTWGSSESPLPIHGFLVVETDPSIPVHIRMPKCSLEKVADWIATSCEERKAVLYGKNEIERLKEEKMCLFRSLREKELSAELDGDNTGQNTSSVSTRILVCWILVFAALSVFLGAALIGTRIPVGELLKYGSMFLMDPVHAGMCTVV